MVNLIGARIVPNIQSQGILESDFTTRHKLGAQYIFSLWISTKSFRAAENHLQQERFNCWTKY